MTATFRKVTTAVQLYVKSYTVSVLTHGYMTVFLKKGAQVGGRTWDLFDFCLFSLTNAAP